ncbi:MAG: DUF4097 family beta strand repeat-containing protein [Cyclobacteriaceae bacterium]
MKTFKQYMLMMALTVFTVTASVSQNQEYKVPLSNPGQPGKLIVKVHKGFIKVKGYTGKEVIVSVVPGDDDNNDEGPSKQGLRRVANTAAPFEIVEEDNEVRIQGTGNSYINFEIKVPNKFSLQLNAHHEGYIEVSDVTGELEVDGHHEDIVLNNIGGSVVADTHHGNITATFTSVTPDVPMAFSTYHGDIEITFPSNTNGSVKVKTTKGDIYTDFEMDLKAEVAQVKTASSKGTKIEVGGWLKGNLGSGGSEFLFSTYHGDIIIRKK